jgi:hypothetical protein
VVAFDPAVGSAKRCKRDYPLAQVIEGVSYEDLCEDSPRAAAAAIRSAAPFDAVLLGWGSLTHVIDASDHLRILRAFDQLAPRGPLLASFFLNSHTLPGRGRLERAAARVGRRVSASPASPERVSSSDPVRCYARVGFSYHFEPAVLEALAAATNRTVTLYRGEFAHATFRQPETSSVDQPSAS